MIYSHFWWGRWWGGRWKTWSVILGQVLAECLLNIIFKFHEPSLLLPLLFRSSLFEEEKVGHVIRQEVVKNFWAMREKASTRIHCDQMWCYMSSSYTQFDRKERLNSFEISLGLYINMTYTQYPWYIYMCFFKEPSFHWEIWNTKDILEDIRTRRPFI